MKKVVFVFELDNTLWDSRGVKHDNLEGPYTRQSLLSGLVKDSKGKKLYPYPEVKTVLQQIQDSDYSIAFISHTDFPERTEELLEITDMERYSDLCVFNNKSRKEQMEILMAKMGCMPEDIIYFDSSRDNIRQLKHLDLNSFLIPDVGLTHDTFIVAMKNVSMWMDVENLGITWGGPR